ncbi:MAG: hypothetical protein ACJ72N_03090 [Labedaea sp.]
MNSLHLTIADQAALALYPELTLLIELRHGHGWFFQPVHLHGQLELVTGTRVWPDRWSDAVAIRDLGDATAFRCDPDGGAVWQHEGGLVDVIDRLVELPAAGEPGAPHLVIGTAPRLWTPDTGFRP